MGPYYRTTDDVRDHRFNEAVRFSTSGILFDSDIQRYIRDLNHGSDAEPAKIF